MAKAKKPADENKEREYIVPLRRGWLRVPYYRRAGKAVKTLKEFIARHMKIPNRDIKQVKLDTFLNEELWFRGRRKPPAKIKVKISMEKNNFIVKLAEPSEYVKFKMARAAKLKESAEEKKKKKAEAVKEEGKKEVSEEKVEESNEKEAAAKEEMLKVEKAMHKQHKHEAMGKHKENVTPRRMALEK
jgi:large subunit ribosomal protein L31e